MIIIKYICAARDCPEICNKSRLRYSPRAKLTPVNIKPPVIIIMPEDARMLIGSLALVE